MLKHKGHIAEFSMLRKDDKIFDVRLYCAKIYVYNRMFRVEVVYFC